MLKAIGLMNKFLNSQTVIHRTPLYLIIHINEEA